ncbi:unnamed protein product [Musa acuminata subsp. burmannicoides]
MPEYSEAHRPLPPPTPHPCTPEGRPTLFADEGYVFAFIAKDSGVDEERAFGMTGCIFSWKIKILY